jgi:putative AdoMet-dependent methyltransferase
MQDFATHVREEHTTLGCILERMLIDAGFTIETANYMAPEYAEYVCRKYEPIITFRR